MREKNLNVQDPVRGHSKVYTVDSESGVGVSRMTPTDWIVTMVPAHHFCHGAHMLLGFRRLGGIWHFKNRIPAHS